MIETGMPVFFVASIFCGLFSVANLSASQKLLFERQIGPFCPWSPIWLLFICTEVSNKHVNFFIWNLFFVIRDLWRLRAITWLLLKRFRDIIGRLSKIGQIRNWDTIFHHLLALIAIVDISQSTGNWHIRHSGFEGKLTIFVLILTTFYSPKHATIYIDIPIPIIYC